MAVDCDTKALSSLASRVRHHCLEHRFASHLELLAKVSRQGEEAVRRAERFRHQTDISIPVGYGLPPLG